MATWLHCMERYLCSQFFIVFLEIYTHMHTHTTETEHDLLSFWILNKLLRVELQCIMSVTEEVFTEAYRVHSARVKQHTGPVA